MPLNRVFKGTGPPDTDLVKKYLFEGGHLSKELASEIISRAAAIFAKEPNLVRLEGRVTIVGDVHGQFYDLVAMLRKLDAVGKAGHKVLFMGDYVDRGPYGPEVVLMLLTLKIRYPNDIVMLRGNHESREMTQQFNFYEQCLREYDADFYDQLMDTFDLLPISALACGQYLAMHGGISQHLSSLQSINEIDRRMEPPDEGLLCDLLWADPAE